MRFLPLFTRQLEFVGRCLRLEIECCAFSANYKPSFSWIGFSEDDGKMNRRRRKMKPVTAFSLRLFHKYLTERKTQPRGQPGQGKAHDGLSTHHQIGNLY